MDLGLRNTLLPGDPRLIDHIVGEVKSQGIFDQFRKDALADVDTKPAYQNLRTRVEASVNSFLNKQTWKTDLNKNQLRETLRKQISDAAYLDAGVERIVDQVVNPKIYSVFMPQIEDVVYKYLGMEKPKREKNGACGLKDLLPIDLDPVSPESDKNSLKDISLDSVDTDLIMTDEKNKEENNGEIGDKIHDNINGEVNNEIINNGHVDDVEKLDEVDKPTQEISTTPVPSQPLDENLLNDTAKSDDKTEEEEEDSPVFEPIDIMNLNESNISNDSHLSGISELTSHRSRSPDFANEFSRDNFDFSNQDSQFSKVSSDSRLSIVTDFGSSNPASTPISDTPKEDSNKDKIISKDNFKAIRNEGDKNKETKIIIDDNKTKDHLSSYSKESSNNNTKNSKNNLASKESLRDETDNVIKDKIEQKDKEKSRESSKSKSSKDRSDSKDSRSHRDRDKDYKKKSSSSESKNDSSERSRTKDRSESGRDTTEKIKESKDLNSTKSKDEKVKESTSSKEPKDLKDIYKEKIRELREKKELTEKEKLNKENKESSKTSKDSGYKKDSSKDKKEHRSSSSSSKSHSSKYESKSKSSSRDDKNSSRSSSKDKSRRDDSRRRDSKESKNKSQTETSEKSESRRSSKSEKDEKSDGKSSQKPQSNKKSSRSDSHNKNTEKSDSKRESESKDKKRRDDKKSKSKDDHGSLRKNSNDRRSSDRDGSNGSNGKGTTDKGNSTTTTALNKESNNANSNSSSETSNGVDEPLTETCAVSHPDITKNATDTNSTLEIHQSDDDNVNKIKKIDCAQSEISLPLKKRPLNNDDDMNIATIISSSSSPSSSSSYNEIPIKKPKFARNFHEAKKLMKIRKKLEKQRFLAQYDLEKKIQSQDESDETSSSSLIKKEDVGTVPDDERVQIIEIRVESDDEPYPDDNIPHTMTTAQSKVIIDGESKIDSKIVAVKSKLSEMELSIRESLNEMMCDDNLEDVSIRDCDTEKSQSINKQTTVNPIKINKLLNNVASTSRTIENKSKTSIDISKQRESPDLSDSDEDCLYFVEDNERLLKFNKFLQSLNNDNNSITNSEMSENETGPVELITMAPPQTKRKYSTSPTSEIILHNSNNNNESHIIISPSTTTMTMYDNESSLKKKKLGRPKKQRPNTSLSSSQSVTNGDHFVMPLSPDSDVSATSEKMPLQLTKEDKSRPRNSQRYTSDDLYKPRPLFVSSSRRNRRSNQS
ncbi:hypothetical protein PV325_006490 [Microctonus aethiopoides]|uniref:BOD1/SHG1 domain-containing protein n=1 Tax=Microctonus aethiopoides TaxID=144406 RepID=A0AA39KKR0_9HYME|nr:hypothetical protein PV325_006490 [Microctonus aethiopoides]KAK0165054.1 hypothetical protein PV328_003610 [Microctonus aethiopoides]